MKTLGLALLLLAIGQTTIAGQSSPFQLDGDLPLHHGRIYPKTARADAWAAMERSLARLSLKLDRRKPDDGVLVTRWHDQGDTAFQYHVFIPPNAEPARVYVGSISSRGGRTQFNDVAGNDVLFTELAKELQQTGESIPKHPQRRAVKSLTLVPPDADISCLRRMVAGESVEKWEKPKEVSRAPSLQVGANLNDGRYGSAVVEGVLGEDGYFLPLRLANGNANNQDLAYVAVGMASLTRYRPATSAGCGVPLAMSFSSAIRR